MRKKPNRFVVGSNHTVEEIEWDGSSQRARRIRTLFEVENCPEFETNNFLEGKADQHGRLFAGTRRAQICQDLEVPTYANFFRIKAVNSGVTLNRPMTIRVSNGICWDERIQTFYYIDSCDYNIRAFDYDPHTGDLSGFNSNSTFSRTVHINNNFFLLFISEQSCHFHLY